MKRTTDMQRGISDHIDFLQARIAASFASRFKCLEEKLGDTSPRLQFLESGKTLKKNLK